MSFPPHDFLQDAMMFYRLLGIASDVNELIADSGLTAEVAHMRGRQYVEVPLVNRGAVALLPVTRSPGAWVTTWPQTPTCDANQMAWPLETDSHLIANFMAAVVNEVLQGFDLPTPFCWGRVETSAIVELADQLVTHGVDRDAVRLAPLRALNDDGEPKIVYGELNELHLSDRNDSDRSLCVRIHPKVGWTVDQLTPYTGGSGRLNLAAALELETVLPRVGVDDVARDELAQLIIADTGWHDGFDDERQLRRYCVTPKEAEVYSKNSAERAAVAWLRWAGFVPTDRRGGQEALTPAVELHVDYTEKQVGLGGVQRYKGVAALGGRTPVVVARAGFSKPARTWADAAEMLLFTLDEEARLWPANELAAEYTPTDIGLRPRTCDDRSCMTVGCVLDDEFCHNNRGTYSDPNAESLRL